MGTCRRRCRLLLPAGSLTGGGGQSSFLQSGHTGSQGGEITAQALVTQPHQAQLRVGAAVGAERQSRQGVLKPGGNVDQPGRGHSSVEAIHGRCIVAAGEQGRAPLRGSGPDQQIPGQGGEFPQKGTDVLAPLIQLVQQQQGRAGIPGQNMLHHLGSLEVPRQAQHIQHSLLIDLPGAGTLVQQGQGIPQSPVAEPGEELRRVLRQGHALLRGYIQQAVRDISGLDPLEGEALAPGENGGWHLVELCGGQDENEVSRGLLQYLQQGIKCRRTEHVDLVHDIHPVADVGGGVDSLVPEGPDMVHTVVGGGIQLQHIQHAAVVDAKAGVALVTGVAVHRVAAVHRLGQDLGAGSLAGAPGTGKEVGVAQAILRHLAAQSIRDMGLPHHILKGLGAPFAV